MNATKGLVVPTGGAVVPSAPLVEEGARNAEEPTRPADIATDLFEVLQHAQAGGCPLGPLLVANDSLHPGPPFTSPLGGDRFCPGITLTARL